MKIHYEPIKIFASQLCNIWIKQICKCGKNDESRYKVTYLSVFSFRDTSLRIFFMSGAFFWSKPIYIESEDRQTKCGQ